jgi:hypothetical protein
MRSLIRLLLVGSVVFLVTNLVHAQEPSAPAESSRSPEEELALLQKEVTVLRQQQAAARAVAAQDEDLKKKVELLAKQVETMEKMIQLLAEQLKKAPPAGAAVDKLQRQVATLESRGVQAARRDQELAQAVDTLAEQRDADRRNEALLPAQLKELFLPSGTNEWPLSIYGQLSANYTNFEGRHGNFETPDFAPFFLLQLNDRFLLETELDFSKDGVELTQAQLDWVVSDWLTVVVGRFLAPIGFFNERLHPTWINKLPDFPLMFRQVSPAADLSLNGIQLRGAAYLGCSPVKLEYALFFTEGLRLRGTDVPELNDLADLGALKETSKDLTDTFAGGGRIGIWVPEIGVTAGVSAMFNGPYTSALVGGTPADQTEEGTPATPPHRAPDDFQLVQVDAGYHKGNWDVRFEYAQMFQNARSFLDQRIHRRGLYAQVAYRPYDAGCDCVRNTELVFRYSYANFKGIDPAGLNFAAFDTPVDVPVNRNQYTFGVNYYPYPSLIVKLAYEINQESAGVRLHDNVFMAQLAWGF